MKKIIPAKTIILALTCLLMLATISIVYADEAGFASIDSTMLNQDPDPAVPGKYVDVRWKIVKYGNEKLEDVRFTLELDYPFYFDSADTKTKNVGDWIGYSGEDEYYILHYKFRVADDAKEGDYTIKLSADSDRASFEEEYTLRVAEKNESDLVIGTITSSPTRLVSGTDEAEISVTLENIGNADAENTNVELKLPDGFEPSYSYSYRSNLGTVESGSSDTATFYFDIPEGIPGKAYPAKLLIRYKDSSDEDNEYKTITLPFDIQIKDKPYFEITSAYTIPSEVRPDKTVEYKIKLKNIGGEKAESVSVKAYKDSSQPFDFDEKSDYVGTLEPGEEGEAVLKLTIDKDAPAKKYLIDLEIRSIYNDEVLTQEEQAAIEIVSEKDKGKITAKGLLVTAAVVIVGLAGYAIGSRKKNR